MKWIGISGSWRTVDHQVETDVRQCVKDFFAQGDGLVTGGALGVDYIATDEALLRNPSASKIKIFLPTSFSVYVNHFYASAEKGVITERQAKRLHDQLHLVFNRNHNALIEMYNPVCDQEAYYRRNKRVIQACDVLHAFSVNNSNGVTHAIEQAKQKGISTHIKRYTIAT